MQNWFKSLIGWQSGRRMHQVTSNVDAKAYLNDLRESELSVGAIFRRGEIVHSAPRQIFSTKSVTNAIRITTEEKTPVQVIPSKSQEDDFTTSLVVGALTGSAILGYAAGNSMIGGLVGASLSENESITTNLEN